MAKSLKTRQPRTATTPQRVDVTDLTGGVDLRRSPTLLGADRARRLKNFSLEEPGALIVRPGYTQASSATLGTGRAQGAQRVYLASTAFTLVAHQGAIYRPTDAWVWGSAVSTGYSTSLDIYFPYDRDLVAALDGATAATKSTNGTTWTLLGIDPSTTGPTLSTTSSGALSSGEFAVAYTYKDRGLGFESNVSPESTITLSGSTGAIHVTAAASADAQVDAYVWYARHKTPDQESVLRKVSSGAASTFTLTSSAWTSNDEAPTNHDVPPILSYATVWKNRWWATSATVGNRLHFSELFLPQAWPETFFIDIPFQKGDSITALQPLGDTLLVYGQSGIFLIIGQTSLDFEVRPSQGATAGAVGFRAVELVEQAGIHASAEGVNSFDGAVDRSLSFDIDREGWRDLVTNVSAAQLARVAVVYDETIQKELRISVPRIYPSNQAGEWVLNLARTREQDGVPAWTTTDRDIALYIHWDGNEPVAGNRGRLFSLPSTHCTVYEETTGTDANGNNLVAEYESGGVSFGMIRTRISGTHLEVDPHAGALSVEIVTDGVSHGAIGLNPGQGLIPYGDAGSPYGTASRTYGGRGRIKLYTPQPLGAEGYAVTTKLVYTGKQRQRIFSYAHDIAPEGAARQL